MSELLSEDAKYHSMYLSDVEVNKALNDAATNSKASTMAKVATMKYLVSQAALGNDMSQFYPGVVKNVITSEFELKKLVYTFCVMYADATDETAELALLAINAFQRDLSVRNPVIRGLALRVLTSIPVSDIAALQLMAVKTAARDASPYVRKLAGLALAKLPVHAVAESRAEIEEIIGGLLADGAVSVLSAAVLAFEELTPNAWHLMDSVFRRLCKVMPDVDEWGQITLLRLLTAYARQAFTQPKAGTKLPAARERKPKSQQTLAFYSDDEAEESDFEDALQVPGSRAAQDHDMLTAAALRLCRSLNPAVVTAVAELYFYAGLPSPARTRTVTGALVRALALADAAVGSALLHFLSGLMASHADALRPHWKSFVPASSEPRATKIIKLHILSQLASADNATSLLREWTAFMTDPDPKFVCAALDALPNIVRAVPSSASKALRGLLALVDAAPGEELVTHAITSTRILLEQQHVEPATLQRIVRLLGRVTDARARAAIVRIIGTHRQAAGMAELVPDALRLLAKGFAAEQGAVKCQILHTARVVARDATFTKIGAVQTVTNYLAALARADLDVHVHDSARLLALDVDAFSTPVASSPSCSSTMPFLPGAPLVDIGDAAAGAASNLRLGTLSSAIGRQLPQHSGLPVWRTTDPDDDARDPEVAKARAEARKRARVSARRVARASSSSSSSGSSSSGSSDSDSDSGSSSDNDSSSSGSESNSESDGEIKRQAAPSSSIIRGRSSSDDDDGDSSSDSSGSDSSDSD